MGEEAVRPDEDPVVVGNELRDDEVGGVPHRVEEERAVGDRIIERLQVRHDGPAEAGAEDDVARLERPARPRPDHAAVGEVVDADDEIAVGVPLELPPPTALHDVEAAGGGVTVAGPGLRLVERVEAGERTRYEVEVQPARPVEAVPDRGTVIRDDPEVRPRAPELAGEGDGAEAAADDAHLKHGPDPERRGNRRARRGGADQRVCRSMSSRNRPSCSKSSSKPPVCTTRPACIT